MRRHRELFGSLRRHRHEIFDDAFQAELETMYRDTGAGHTPTAPALMCMVLLLQSYVGVSDAEAVEAPVLDARWKLVLDCLEEEEPVFSQGGLQQFRERLMACASKMTRTSRATISQEARCPLFLASSVKAGLDVTDSSDKEQKADAINELMGQMESLVSWVEENLERWSKDDPIQYYLVALEQFEEQNLERDANDEVSFRPVRS